MTLSTMSPSSFGGPAYVIGSPDDVPFFDAEERPIIVDSLMALEAQLFGSVMMPPRGVDDLQQRIVAMAIRIGSSPAQLVNHWLYWAQSGGR